MENLMVPIWLAIVGAFALGGLLLLGVMGVVSFFRAWERGDTEFSASMPAQPPDRSPLHSVEARIARGESKEDEELARRELERMIRRRERSRRDLEGK